MIGIFAFIKFQVHHKVRIGWIQQNRLKTGNYLYMLSNEKTSLLNFSQNLEKQCSDSIPVEVSTLGKLNFRQRAVRD
jgi:hypothetical protein